MANDLPLDDSDFFDDDPEFHENDGAFEELERVTSEIDDSDDFEQLRSDVEAVDAAVSPDGEGDGETIETDRDALLIDDSQPSPQLWAEDVEVPPTATPVVESIAQPISRRSEAGGFVRRTKARELALQMLFQLDLNPETTEQDVADQLRERLPQADLFQFAWDLFRGVVKDRETLDREIASTATNWRVSRMAATDRNVLRLGAYELQYMDTPYGVVLDEAIDLAKKFGAGQSAAFVNGVLDKLVPTSKRPDRERGKVASDPDKPAGHQMTSAAPEGAIPSNASPEDVAKRVVGSPISFRRKQQDLAVSDGTADDETAEKEARPNSNNPGT